MKNKRKIILLIVFLLGLAITSMAGDPPPVDGDPTGGGTPIGGSAPLEQGYLVLILLAFFYGIYNYSKKCLNLKIFSHEK
ncbi:MAG TPA: hypothetical protein DCG69_09115 [Bacteroidales bacterium]|nr:hypothetical protein [Bacteroidales bacterium]